MTKTNVLTHEVPNNQAPHAHEFLEGIHQLNVVDPKSTRSIFHESIPEPGVFNIYQILMKTGEARSCSLEGDLIAAEALFDEILSQVDRTRDIQIEDGRENPAAYIWYEYAAYLRMLKAGPAIELALEKCERIAVTQKLKLLIAVQKELLTCETSRNASSRKIMKLVQSLRDQKLSISLCAALLRLAQIEIFAHDFEAAAEFIEEGLTVSGQQGYLVLQQNIKSVKALLLRRQGQIEESIALLQEVLREANSKLVRASCLRQLGMSYKYLDDHDNMRSTLEDALEFAQANGVIAEIPMLGRMLGAFHVEQAKDPQKAFYYFELASSEAMRQSERGIPLNGFRLTAVRAFNEFLLNHAASDLRAASRLDYLTYAKDLDWVRIKDIFHYNLIIYHQLHTGRGQRTLDTLNVSASTFYSVIERMKARGIEIPKLRDQDEQLPEDLFIPSLQKYITQHKSKTWKEVNQIFEGDMYEFLFKLYGYNKARLAEKLQTAYSTVLLKTKHLTGMPKTETSSI